MNQTPDAGHHQNHSAQSASLRKTLLPGIIVVSIGSLLALIGSGLPFVSVGEGAESEGTSIVSLASSGGRTVAGILIMLAVIVTFVPPVIAYFKTTLRPVRLAGFLSIGAGISGVTTVLFTMFVIAQDGGDTVSESINMAQSYGVDAGFSIGAYLTLAGFISGIIGGVLFTMRALPYARALAAERQAAT